MARTTTGLTTTGPTTTGLTTTEFRVQAAQTIGPITIVKRTTVQITTVQITTDPTMPGQMVRTTVRTISEIGNRTTSLTIAEQLRNPAIALTSLRNKSVRI